MPDKIQVLIVGTGCSICGAVLADHWLALKDDQPFLIDEKLLQLFRKGEYYTILDMLKTALKVWDREQDKFKEANPDAKGEVVPFMMTDETSFIAKGVYDELKRRSEH